jgi:hypothetical protein
MGKPTTTISAPQVHSILRAFNYDFVAAPADRELKQIAKAAAKAFPGVKISTGGDSVYFQYVGNDSHKSRTEFFVPAKGMILPGSLEKLEKLTGIKFAEHLSPP